MTKKDFLTLFFETLNSQNINYFVYGNYNELPADTGGSDIDIVIAECERKRFLTVFDKLMESTSAFVASYFKSTHSYMYRILNGNEGDYWGVQIDIFFKGFCHHNVSYFPISFIHDSIISHHNIKVLEETRGYYIGFLKELIHTAKVKQKYVDGFVDLINSDRERYLEELQKIYGNEFKELIEENLHTKDFPYKKLQHLMRVVVHKHSFFSDIYSKISRFYRLFNKRPGYVIVVEGTDGSGKSTIINAFTPWLNECFHNGVVYNHLRPNLIDDLGVVLGKKEKKSKPVINSTPHAGKPSGFIGSLCRWSYYMLDYTIGYMKIVWPIIHTKSKVFVFDRYYYDYYVDPYRSSTILPNWILKLGEKLIATPDLILCLGGDPEKIYARKPETSLEEVKRQTEVLKEFASTHKKAVWVDTTTTPEESIKAAMDAIVKMMSKRFANTKL